MVAALLRREVAELRQAVAGRSPHARATLAAVRADRGKALTLAGYDPEPTQQALLRSSDDRDLVLTCRQWGKSTAGAGLAVAEVLLTPRALVLLLSPSLRQSGEIFQKALGVYDGLGRPIPETRRTATTLELLNGSRLISLPGKPATVRGFSKPRLIVVDEAAFADDGLFVAVKPMLARSRGRLVLLSTPYGMRGEFYRAWTSGTGWTRTRVTADQCTAITAEFLKVEKADLGPRWFAQEYFCEFVSVVGAVFDAAAVEAALEAGVRPLFLGSAA